MGYIGDTYGIPCDRGGLTHNPNIDKIKPEMMVWPSKNICLNEGGREKRGGTAHVNSSALASTPELMGIHHYVKKNGNEFRVMATSDGKIYKNDTDTIYTGLSNDRITTFVTYNDILYICNGTDTPLEWDGADSSAYPFSGVEGTDISFVDGVVATGTFTLTDNPADGETIIINGVTFTFKTTPTDETIQFEIKGDKGLTADEVAANLEDSSRGSSNSEISIASYASDTVDTITVTYDTKTLDGNSYTLVVGTADASISGATLTGGLNAVINRSAGDYLTRGGTPFAAGQIVKVAGSTSNDGDYTIESVTSGVLTLADDTTLTAEGASADILLSFGLPSDWTGSNNPKQMIKHGRGVSERLWAIGFSTNNYDIYASANGSADFSDANVVTLRIDTGDGVGLVGGVEFGDRLFVFSKRSSFIVDDSSATVANWGYQKSQWDGGAANMRLIVRTPNDLICMMEDGTAYSIRALEAYGDYKSVSLTKPSHIDKWIKEHTDLSAVEKFHAIFDPVDRAVLFFVVRNGYTSIDSALVYYVDRGPEEGWMVYDNQDFDSGYSASSSALFRTGVGNYEVYTGDYSGFVWKLNQTNRSDNNNAYWAGFRTPWLTFDNPRVKKDYKRGWGVVQAEGNYDLEVRWWVDGIEGTSSSINLGGTGGLLDSFVLGTDVLGGEDLIDKDFDLGDKGKRISIEVYNNTADELFMVSQILVDHRVLGAAPQ